MYLHRIIAKQISMGSKIKIIRLSPVLLAPPRRVLKYKEALKRSLVGFMLLFKILK